MAILQRGCCCTLRTCVLVLGWICVVLSVLALIGTAYMASKDCSEFASKSSSIFPIKITTRETRQTLYKECKKSQNTLIAQVVFFVIWCIVSILLLVGVYKANRFLLIPFMVGHTLMLVYSIIGAIIQAVALGFTTQVIGYLVGTLIGIAISVYILLCVISHYQELRDGVVVSGAHAPKV